jgi:hypothetical protein
MLLHPSTLLLMAVDAIPALGVLFWQWDAFVLDFGPRTKQRAGTPKLAAG